MQRITSLAASGRSACRSLDIAFVTYSALGRGFLSGTIWGFRPWTTTTAGEITGRAWVTAFHQYVLDPSDSFPTGYTLSDTWPIG